METFADVAEVADRAEVANFGNFGEVCNFGNFGEVCNFGNFAVDASVTGGGDLPPPLEEWLRPAGRKNLRQIETSTSNSVKLAAAGGAKQRQRLVNLALGLV